MHLNMVSFEGFAGSSTSVVDIYIHTKPQIEHDYWPHANGFINNAIDRKKACLMGYLSIYKNSTWKFAWDHG